MHKRKWNILGMMPGDCGDCLADRIISALLLNRGIRPGTEYDTFLNPPHPDDIPVSASGIDPEEMDRAVRRIKKGIERKESIVVYADYDADGITSGAVLWEAIHRCGGSVMPYIPHRAEEGYGLSKEGIDAVVRDHHPSLIVTVDHGITARDMVGYAKTLGIDVVVSDHHVKPDILPECTIVHTTGLAGVGVTWMLARELLRTVGVDMPPSLLMFAAIGTTADMVPLLGVNCSIVKHGLAELNGARHIGIGALIHEAGLDGRSVGTYDISHVLAPRLNAMGRMVHAMDALRLLCTKNEKKAHDLALLLGSTNKERQQLTLDTTLHAIEKSKVPDISTKKLIMVGDSTYNPGIIGLVAGKLVEEYYRPSVVLSIGGDVAKGSARSVPGFNIIDAIRSCSDDLIDAGGHPMAAGFTIKTGKIDAFRMHLEHIADTLLTDEKLVRTLHIDMEVPLRAVNEDLWLRIQELAPFGLGNYEPVFAARGVQVTEARLVGKDGKHLKLKVRSTEYGMQAFDAIAFGQGAIISRMEGKPSCDIAYTIGMNEWNSRRQAQLILKDIL